MIPPFTPEQQAQAQAIIDDACECDPAFAAAWYAECRKQLSPPKPVERTNTAPSRASSPADPPFAPAPATPVPMRASRRRVGE